MKSIVSNFFESKVRHESTTEDGTQVKMNSLLVVDALSFSECETRINEYAGDNYHGEFEVLTENKAAYKEVFLTEGEKFYKLKVAFITIDEKTEKQKKSKVTYLVQADSIEGAQKVFDEVMHDSMADYVVESVHETVIEDIIVCETKEVTR